MRSGQPSRLWTNERQFIQFMDDRFDRLTRDDGLFHVVSVDEHHRKGHRIDQLVKRCILSSSFVVLEIPKMRYLKVSSDGGFAGFSSGWEMTPDLEQIEETLVSAGLDANEYCVVLPESVSLYYQIDGGEDALDAGDYERHMNSEFRRIRERVDTVSVSAQASIVQRLLAQEDGTVAGASFSAGLTLPDLRGLSLADLSRLRRDHEDAFVRLRYALRKYLNGLSDSTSETQFRELIEEIDYECRMVEGRFEAIRKGYRRSLEGMTVTSSLIGIAAALHSISPAASAVLSTAAGSATFGELIQSRVKKSSDLAALRDSDFWIAWQVHQAAKEARKKNA
ncbi:hypothetical protein ACFYP6_39455 [Streptomyces goshikiensis]|uniref:hypothetical protein n=1 Tax=Streptomyces goshikiensis TaxID=1942 RepID=UPI0036753983